MITTTTSPYIKNFPFPTLREKQTYVLKEIDAAFASDYNHIIVEAPTGFGKSPVAIAVCRTLGTSYICTSTKDLQAQYTRDFPFIKVAKGKNNFICAVKEDFIKNGTYKCQCQQSQSWKCYHTTAEYGPCTNNLSFQYDGDSKCHGCKYRTTRDDYGIKNKGTTQEEVFLDNDTIDRYRYGYSKWSFLQTSGLKEELKTWRPCEYYHQLNIASEASHSILNYPMFLALLTTERPFSTPTLLSRELLILDEAHRLEEEIVKFVGLSISDKLKSPDFDFKIPDYGYGDMDKWLSFLIELKEKLATLLRSQKILAEHVGEVGLYIIKLGWAIENITKDPTNWVISDIKKKEKDKDLYRYYNSEQKEEVIKVELKPLDVSGQKKEAYNTLTKEQQRFWKRILIVDDDADLTITFKAVIEESNSNNDVNKRIEVYTSNDPVAALSEFKPNFYDLLLVDINMPHMNGFELCEKIFAIDINVKVCLMSSGEINWEALREMYPTRQEGCFIRKPVTTDYLLKRIRSELD